MILTLSLALLGSPAIDPDQDIAVAGGAEARALGAVAEEVAAQVAELRGKPFRGEVRVRVADPSTFLDYARKRMDELHGPERMEQDQSVARLAGLVRADLDLEDITLAVLQEQVGGFYEPGTGTFFVMEGMDPDLARVVMAHELAHALDDQYHDLDGTDRALRTNSDALLAHHAVAEGSAQVIMSSWLQENLATLDTEVLREIQESLESKALQSAPPYVWKPMLALYNQGQAFLERRATLSMMPRKANMDDLEIAFQDLPRSTEQILHPVKYWDAERRDDPVDVQLSFDALPAGWTVALQDTFGEMMLALLAEPLSERLGMSPSPLALYSTRYTTAAAAGWGGDRYLLLENGDAQILHLTTVWDAPGEADEFSEAMHAVSLELDAERVDEVTRGTLGYAVRRVDETRVDWTAWIGVDDQVAREISAGIGVQLEDPQASVEEPDSAAGAVESVDHEHDRDR